MTTPSFEGRSAEVREHERRKEVNELCRRLGEAVRYPLEFEQGEMGKEAYV
jgi:hypothetical protein